MLLLCLIWYLTKQFSDIGITYPGVPHKLTDSWSRRTMPWSSLRTFTTYWYVWLRHFMRNYSSWDLVHIMIKGITRGKVLWFLCFSAFTEQFCGIFIKEDRRYALMNLHVCHAYSQNNFKPGISLTHCSGGYYHSFQEDTET